MTIVGRRPDVGTPRGGRNRHRWLVLIVVALLVLAAGVAMVFTFRASETHVTHVVHPPSATATASTAPSASASPWPSASASAPFELGYLPLYPFVNLADAQAWVVSHRSGGHQPWHADAGQTALAFTQGYLGFAPVNMVTGIRTDSAGAHVAVGYRDPENELHTAAVLHLVRFGSESDAPWEVVGTDDTSFTLDTPGYGTTVTSPVTVGGKISGVDEIIVVTIRQLGTQHTLGTSSGTPAGGHNEPWSAPVSFSDATDHVLTIIARTGGHLQDVERFAITGVRH